MYEREREREREREVTQYKVFADSADIDIPVG